MAKNGVSEHPQPFGGYLDFAMQSWIIQEGFLCTWHWLEQVEKMPLNFITHFSDLVSP